MRSNEIRLEKSQSPLYPKYVRLRAIYTGSEPINTDLGMVEYEANGSEFDAGASCRIFGFMATLATAIGSGVAKTTPWFTSLAISGSVMVFGFLRGKCAKMIKNRKYDEIASNLTNNASRAIDERVQSLRAFSQRQQQPQVVHHVVYHGGAPGANPPHYSQTFAFNPNGGQAPLVPVHPVVAQSSVPLMSN